jgi:hypothetical protein
VNISFGVTALPHMRDMTFSGRHRRVRHGQPPDVHLPSDERQEEETRAADIVKGLTACIPRGDAGRRSGRHVVLREGPKSGDFESGVRMALQSVLMSPRFLFRSSRRRLSNGQRLRLLSPERSGSASRLSFFLWAPRLTRIC